MKSSVSSTQTPHCDINKKCLRFIGDKTAELIQHGFNVHLTNRKHINNRYSGTFDPIKKEIRVALGYGDLSVCTFLHEYAHFLQWRDRPEFWQEYFEYGMRPFLNWVSGCNYPATAVDRYFKRAVAIERDAECTAVDLMYAHKLSLDVEEYLQCANANLLLYPWVRITRSWGNGKLPENDEAMTINFPKELLSVAQVTNMRAMRAFFKQFTSESS